MQNIKRMITTATTGHGGIMLILFVIAFGLRVGLLAVSLDQTSADYIAHHPSDSPEYVQLAEDIARLDISHENTLYMVGFGYALFLAGIFLISGHSLICGLIVQIILSSIATVLIYKIGLLLFRRPLIATIAAVLNAVSLTSVTLSLSILSDTLFFFLLTLTVYLYVQCFSRPKLSRLLLLAVIIALATFVRSVGQFLPVVLFVAALVIPARYFVQSKGRGILYIGITMALALMVISVWALRNYAVHGTFSVAGTGIEAAGKYLGARVAANASDSLSTGEYQELFRQEMTDNGSLTPSPKHRRDWYLARLSALFRADPILFVKTYVSIIGYNILAYDDNYHFRFPDYRHGLDTVVSWLRTCGINIMVFLLTLCGAAILFYRKEYSAVIPLGLFYLYFALLSGFTFWQGSRIFYPAQLAGACFLAITLDALRTAISRRFKR
ncbi:MAG: glycosyltransferase family 39 protein [candidate division Zixibacteria bacterium]|nr:glycosyltransferase family 39 protein [candidate division Zixibacteria bacterium]